MTPAPDSPARRRQLVEGEFAFTEDDFDRIARMLHEDAGIALSESKATLVYSRLAKRLRALVSFRELNLIGTWPMTGQFDAIFCRNVVIYFQEETQSRVWDRFLPLLAPGGRLYIGHSERLNGPAASAFVSDGLTTYRFADGAGAKGTEV